MMCTFMLPNKESCPFVSEIKKMSDNCIMATSEIVMRTYVTTRNVFIISTIVGHRATTRNNIFKI